MSEHAPVAGRSVEFTFRVDPRQHRTLVEILYGMCLHCWHRVHDCACHERGYN